MREFQISCPRGTGSVVSTFDSLDFAHVLFMNCSMVLCLCLCSEDYRPHAHTHTNPSRIGCLVAAQG